MEFEYALIPTVRFNLNRADDFNADGVFVDCKVMDRAFIVSNTNNFFCLCVDYDLGFYCVSFFLPE